MAIALLHAEIIAIPERACSEQPRDLTPLCITYSWAEPRPWRLGSAQLANVRLYKVYGGFVFVVLLESR